MTRSQAATDLASALNCIGALDPDEADWSGFVVPGGAAIAIDVMWPCGTQLQTSFEHDDVVDPDDTAALNRIADMFSLEVFTARLMAAVRRAG